MYLLGCDIGSSSVKTALVNAATGETVGVTQSPAGEMKINAPQPGFAEQDPEMWWQHLCRAVRRLLSETEVRPADIKSIGIAYQMHGLTAVNKDREVLRPAIIWCDSRAAELGEQAYQAIGAEICLRRSLNSPANFTASKLKWVRDNEPEVYAQIDKIMLPGDYIALRLTGELRTTVQGLSEGILWDFSEDRPADFLLTHYGISPDLLPEYTDALAPQGVLTAEAAAATGLTAGTPLSYRAGDQPNNALSLNVLEPGEIAATGGTSGVVFSVTDRLLTDPTGTTNAFAHINHSNSAPRIGTLLCINGAGILYAYLQKMLTAGELSYAEMSRAAAEIPVGAEGLRILPFGNGAERMLHHQNPGAQILHLDFNRHTRAHLYRAGLEGIAFSFLYGMEKMREAGHEMRTLRVGNDNLFRARVFAETIAAVAGCRIEIIETTGAVGAAKAAGVVPGVYGSLRGAMTTVQPTAVYEDVKGTEAYRAAYEAWRADLEKFI